MEGSLFYYLNTHNLFCHATLCHINLEMPWKTVWQFLYIMLNISHGFVVFWSFPLSSMHLLLLSKLQLCPNTTKGLTIPKFIYLFFYIFFWIFFPGQLSLDYNAVVVMKFLTSTPGFLATSITLLPWETSPLTTTCFYSNQFPCIEEDKIFLVVLNKFIFTYVKYLSNFQTFINLF